MPDYGLDIWCTTDIDPLLADVTEAELMAQVCLRRLFTRLGALISAQQLEKVEGFVASALADGARRHALVPVHAPVSAAIRGRLGRSLSTNYTRPGS